MRKYKFFSDKKLTHEEFAKKYWGHGQEYQYHTGKIEDGRDEREQFVFNNIRALFGLFDGERKRTKEYFSDYYDKEIIDKKTKKTLLLVGINIITSLLVLAGCLWDKIF